MITQNRRLWAVFFVCLAVGTLIVVAAALPTLEFRPGQVFSIEPTPEAEGSVPGGPQAEVQTPPYLVILWVILLVAMAAEIVGIIFSPELRKRLLRLLPALLVLAAFLLNRLRPGAVPASPAALPGAAQPLASQAVVAVFDPSPPDWLLWATGIGMALMVLLAIAVPLWLFWPRERRTPGPLQELAGQAQSAMEALEAGADVRDTILRCYFEMAETVSRARGIDRALDMTPREFEQRLVEAGLPRRPVQRLTRLFEQVRYGARTSDRGEEQEAITCLAAIAQACPGSSQ
jgi:hypothetical protein